MPDPCSSGLEVILHLNLASRTFVCLKHDLTLVFLCPLGQTKNRLAFMGSGDDEHGGGGCGGVGGRVGLD